MREKIASAQTAVKSAQTHAATAAEKIAAAEKIVSQDNAAIAPTKIPELRDALGSAHSNIDSLTNDLLNAQIALQASQTNVSTLEKKVADQTRLLNTANDTIAARDKVIAKDAEDEKKYHRLKFILCAAAAALAAAMALRLKSALLFIPPPLIPYATIALMIGVPGLVFGLLWRLL